MLFVIKLRRVTALVPFVLTAALASPTIAFALETLSRRKPSWSGTLQAVGLFFLYLIAVLLTVWAAMALYIDLPIPSIKHLAAVSYVLLIVFLATRVSGHLSRFLVCVIGCAAVLTWWLQLKPTNEANWQPDVAAEPWGEIHGNRVILHNFRFCHYRTDKDYDCEWLTKAVDLSQLRGLDLFMSYWGSPYIAHPILSFDFGNNNYVAASIEQRKKVGQHYSVVLSFFRQYELAYVFAEERDIVAVRTNVRNERVFLYHTVAGPEWARKLFVEYVLRANRLRERPAWYNAFTENCTTVIFHAMADIGRLPPGTSLYNFRTIFNGLGIQMLYQGKNLQGQLPLPELQESAQINAAAQKADQSGDFSLQIRQGRPGFESLPQNQGLDTR
jgi:Domain of unknown function (DUF4105)